MANSLLNFLGGMTGGSGGGNILMQAIGAMLRGDSPQDFMQIAGQNLLNAQQRSTDQINVIQGFNAIQQSLAGLSSQLGSCCCDIKSTLLQDKYDAALREIVKLQNEASNAAQSAYLLSTMGKWVANPAAAA